MANTLAYGFIGLEELSKERVNTVGVPRIWDAIMQSAAEHTRQVNELMASFVERTTEAKQRFQQPGAGTLQPIDEWGVPQPVREEGYYDVAYPIQGGAHAWGTNRVSRALMTVKEANRQTVEAIRRDADWIRRHLLAAVFDNVSWTFNDRVGANGNDGLGSITIEPLANGDTVAYLKTSGGTATDTHYLAQASAIDDSNDPFDDIYTELMEHPGNAGGAVVVYVPTNLTSTIEALTAFVPVADPEIAYGASTDLLRGSISAGFGQEVLGRVDKCWIVEWQNLPDNYMLAHAQGGGPVLKMREYPAPELQGFFPEDHSPNGNLEVLRMIRYAGFGVVNRTGAVVYRIGNGSYGIPSGYDAPLAV